MSDIKNIPSHYKQSWITRTRGQLLLLFGAYTLTQQTIFGLSYALCLYIGISLGLDDSFLPIWSIEAFDTDEASNILEIINYL